MKALKLTVATIFSLIMLSLAVILWVAAANSGMTPYMIFVCAAITVVAAGLSWVAFMLTDL